MLRAENFMSDPQVAVFVPYRNGKEGLEFFLQKRDINAPTHPNIFSMFGGGIENGENATDAVLREIKEELEYVPKELEIFPEQFVSDANGKVFAVFIEHVAQDFESSVHVMEGEYGLFLHVQDISIRSDISQVTKTVVAAIAASLARSSD